MKCMYCATELIHGGDHDKDDGGAGIVSNLSCPTCGSFVLVYSPDWGEEEEGDEEE